MKFIYWHGWGYDSTFFSPLTTILSDLSEFNAIHVNEGYFGTPHIPLDINSPEQTIGIGHSQGFSRLIKTYPNLKAYISLNGFTQFMQSPDFPAGTPKSVLGAMIQQFQRHPQTVLETFYRKTGYVQKEWQFNRDDELLRQNLTALRSLKAKLPNAPILAIVSEQDLIAPKELQQLCFPDYHLIHGSGHSLVYSHGIECANLIVDFIKNLSK